MPQVVMTHSYKDHPIGSVVEVSDEEAERVIKGKGGHLVETATRDVPAAVETRDEDADALTGDDEPAAEPARKGKGKKA